MGPGGGSPREGVPGPPRGGVWTPPRGGVPGPPPGGGRNWPKMGIFWGPGDPPPWTVKKCPKGRPHQRRIIEGGEVNRPLIREKGVRDPPPGGGSGTPPGGGLGTPPGGGLGTPPGGFRDPLPRGVRVPDFWEKLSENQAKLHNFYPQIKGAPKRQFPRKKVKNWRFGHFGDSSMVFGQNGIFREKMSISERIVRVLTISDAWSFSRYRRAGWPPADPEECD